VSLACGAARDLLLLLLLPCALTFCSSFLMRFAAAVAMAD